MDGSATNSAGANVAVSCFLLKLLLLQFTRRTAWGVGELGHYVSLFFAEIALHAITLTAVIGGQHAIWVLKIEASQLAALTPLSNPFEHLVPLH
jgi:hypothetical protein